MIINSYQGFYLDKKHSSIYGIIRCSKGIGFEECLPTIKDITSDSQQNGQYWYETKYSEKEIQIDFVYSTAKEDTFSQLKRLLNSKKTFELILDENPYKGYYVKIKKSILQKLPFLQGGDLTYSGNGSITFATISPYSHSTVQHIEDVLYENYTQRLMFCSAKNSFGAVAKINQQSLEDLKNFANNKAIRIDQIQPMPDGLGGKFYLPFTQWAEGFSNSKEFFDACDLPSTKYYNIYNNQKISFYNGGDIEAYPNFFFKIKYEYQSIVLENLQSKEILQLNVPPFENGKPVTHIQVNMKDKLLYGYKAQYPYEGASYFDLVRTGTLHNDYIVAGDFFSLPRGASTLKLNTEPFKVTLSYLYL